MFTWSGLSSPTYDSIANLQVSGMTIVVVAAVLAGLMGILRIQQAAAEAGRDPSFDGFEDLGLDEFEADSSEGLGLVGQLVRHLLAIFLLGGLMTGFLDLAIIGGVALLSQPIASRVLRNDRFRNLLRGIPWVIRFVVGFGLTYVIGYVINTVRYEPLARSEFFPLVLTVAFGLLIFQVLLSDADADADTDDDEGEEEASAPSAKGEPSAGGVVGAALVIFAVGAMLQLALPAVAFADNCSGLLDCNATIGAAAAAAAGAAAAATGAAASRNQNRNKRRRKKRRKKEPEVELTVGEPTRVPPEDDFTIGEPRRVPPDTGPEN
ncbi:MAG: hypothetical protein H0W81_07195 [Chloroflexi bacterium]|nr:hypothetical protein [Chloroflexota bacterium]